METTKRLSEWNDGDISVLSFVRHETSRSIYATTTETAGKKTCVVQPKLTALSSSMRHGKIANAGH